MKQLYNLSLLMLFLIGMQCCAADKSLKISYHLSEHFIISKSASDKKFGWAVNTWGEYTNPQAMQLEQAGWMSVIARGGISMSICQKIAKSLVRAVQDDKILGFTDPKRIIKLLVSRINMKYLGLEVNSKGKYKTQDYQLSSISCMIQAGQRHLLITGFNTGSAGSVVPTLEIIQDEELYLPESSWHHVLPHDAESPSIEFVPHEN